MQHDLASILTDLERIEKRVSGEVAPGRRHRAALLVCIAVLAIGLVLPQATGASTWTVLSAWFVDSEVPVAVPLRVFDTLAIVFGVATAIATVLTRRWRGAVVTLMGCGLATVFGLFAFWTQRSLIDTHPHSPGIGLVVAWLAVAASVALWTPVAVSVSPTRQA